MPRARKRSGFNRRGRSEHPGVSIAVDHSGGRSVVVLRWRDPAPAGQSGKRRKQIVRGADGAPVTSREKAKRAAVAKSDELREEQSRINEGAQATNYDGTWKALIESHSQYLKAKGSAPKTILDYQQTWPFLERWQDRPSSPAKLTVDHLRGFVVCVKSYVSKKTGRQLSPHSVAAVIRHVKALLNFGRKELSCVRLDGESINRGLVFGKLPKLLPIAHSSCDLRAILNAAIDCDANHPRGEVFPLLAFLMLTGCRRGEAEALRWFPSAPGVPESWVDSDAGRVVIYGSKTGTQRSVPLAARPMLQRVFDLLRSGTDIQTEPYVFGGPLPLAISDRRHTQQIPDQKPIIGRSLKSAIQAVQRDSGVAWKIKDLRSTLASYAANSVHGLNLYTLAGELGHDYAVLTKHYAGHMTLPESQANAATIEGLLGIEQPLEAWLAQWSSEKGASSS